MHDECCPDRHGQRKTGSAIESEDAPQTEDEGCLRIHGHARLSGQERYGERFLCWWW